MKMNEHFGYKSGEHDLLFTERKMRNLKSFRETKINDEKKVCT